MQTNTQVKKTVKKSFYRNHGKRTLDLLLTIPAVILLIPVFVLVGLIIKLDSSGTILYKQKRVGKNSKEFYIYKFRTMVSNADRIGPTSTKSGDNRITKVGKILRKTSIDELPQLFNVLIGNMSIVGPRPDVPGDMEIFPKEHIEKRLMTAPGITGLSQVNGRSHITLDRRMHYDEKYVDNQSLRMDISIIITTFSQIIKKEGVN
ncbi:sugar transferase [Tissierella sp.]|uniref:sugar transferase n=1 Tax=Tissierella sp. TaxID=41274 RepID=UPI00285F33C3|nr:sugar transferase [Tissierella sp.]MDR7857549.1 sugar transferase [Tissierella sp.]